MSLLDEINSYGASQQENNLGDEALAADPLPGDPLNSPDADSNLLHTNVDKQSQDENDSQQITEESEKSLPISLFASNTVFSGLRGA
jgi:hypothetical protein